MIDQFQILWRQKKQTKKKTILEQLDGDKESASFEIVALFTLLYGERKSATISKSADFWVL